MATSVFLFLQKHAQKGGGGGGGGVMYSMAALFSVVHKSLLSIRQHKEDPRE